MARLTARYAVPNGRVPRDQRARGVRIRIGAPQDDPGVKGIAWLTLAEAELLHLELTNALALARAAQQPAPAAAAG